MDLDISVEYSELDKTTLLLVSCRGQPYNPFDGKKKLDDNLGISILQHIAKGINVTYDNHRSQVLIKL